MRSNEFNDKSELAWLAEQYVLGELSSSECDAFESRLATEQAAREAVANAVSLMGSVAAAKGSSDASVAIRIRSVGSNWVTRISWLSGVAAVLAIGAFVTWRVKFGEQERTTALATAWSETRDSIDESHSEESIVIHESSYSDLEELDVPDWLVTAVSLRDEASTTPQRSPLKPNAGEGA